MSFSQSFLSQSLQLFARRLQSERIQVGQYEIEMLEDESESDDDLDQDDDFPTITAGEQLALEAMCRDMMPYLDRLTSNPADTMAVLPLFHIFEHYEKTTPIEYYHIYLLCIRPIQPQTTQGWFKTCWHYLRGSSQEPTPSKSIFEIIYTQINQDVQGELTQYANAFYFFELYIMRFQNQSSILQWLFEKEDQRVLTWFESLSNDAQEEFSLTKACFKKYHSSCFLEFLQLYRPELIDVLPKVLAAKTYFNLIEPSQSYSIRQSTILPNDKYVIPQGTPSLLADHPNLAKTILNQFNRFDADVINQVVRVIHFDSFHSPLYSLLLSADYLRYAMIAKWPYLLDAIMTLLSPDDLLDLIKNSELLIYLSIAPANVLPVDIGERIERLFQAIPEDQHFACFKKCYFKNIFEKHATNCIGWIEITQSESFDNSKNNLHHVLKKLGATCITLGPGTITTLFEQQQRDLRPEQAPQSDPIYRLGSNI